MVTRDKAQCTASTTHRVSKTQACNPSQHFDSTNTLSLFLWSWRRFTCIQSDKNIIAKAYIDQSICCSYQAPPRCTCSNDVQTPQCYNAHVAAWIAESSYIYACKATGSHRIISSASGPSAHAGELHTSIADTVELLCCYVSYLPCLGWPGGNSLHGCSDASARLAFSRKAIILLAKKPSA